MLEPILIGALLLLLVVQHITHGRQASAERAHHYQHLQKVLEGNRNLANQIVLLKVQPQTAAVVAAGELAPPQDIGPLTDEELAELEAERIEARR